MERLILTQPERDDADRIVDGLKPVRDDWDPMDLADRVMVAAERLPARVREFMARVRSTESELTLLSGLPISADLPHTPTGWESAAKTGAGRREETLLMLCASALGETFGWASQQDGRVVHDVCPAPGMERSLTSASSEGALTLHTEDIFHPCRADYVALLCLRNPDAVGTTYVRAGNLTLPRDVADVLARQRFRFYPDDSHVGTVLPGADDRLAGRTYQTGAVLFGPIERPYLRFDYDFMAAEDGDEAAGRAVEVTAECLGASVERIVLQPGDAVFLDNYRVVHGRESFAPRYDGNDRWLKRVNVIRDVRRIYSMSDRRSRVLA